VTYSIILHDGPLDGEQQCINELNTSPGSVLFLSVPHYQVFDPASDGATVIDLGIQASYVLKGPGPAPNPGPPNFDTWSTSWILEFVPQSYVYPSVPSTLPPPVTMPLPNVVTMEGDTAMTITADDPSAGVPMEGDTGMEIDADTQPYQWGAVAMTVVTVMTVDGDDLPPSS
jgi:hypothetical protein